MNKVTTYIEAYQKLIGFKIKFKSESRFQKILSYLVSWYIPTYLTHYTTVVGQSIFFPSRANLERSDTRFVIAHEVVHLLDQRRLTTPVFLLLYLSPQIFALGVLSFPWLKWNALWFLIFALPWPSPGRIWLEARAYALEMNLYIRCGRHINKEDFVNIFQAPNYYFMSWSKRFSERLLTKYFDRATSGQDVVFKKVIDAFDSCENASS